MKYKFPIGNQINKGRKSPRKGKSMIEEYGLEKAMELKKRIKEKQIGKLEKGFEYHHPEPYKFDDFFILEKGQHRWMHTHPQSFVLGGLNK